MYKWLQEKDVEAERRPDVPDQKDVVFGQVEKSVHIAVKGKH